ncbi:DUF441 domain-containing protein [Tumebacillus sp. ITR2]|uniref:UPF0756 membrane protein JJB07_13775 n=1 Tax=Tumebacillus amylolyticus TaxID=2801339 RepID=A0ABS1JBU3_9BACL|nr:DUF441 domain-containing protein [Tumebacillus amylolyticus]MBL0387705.1 DUF441 domain-containing protein [Tumebacillus amylolyticus]
MEITNLLLLLLLAVGIVGNNTSVSIAVAVLLLVRLLHLDRVVPYLENYGLQVGVIILTIGVLAPIASGKIGTEDLLKTFLSWKSILAIGVGIFVSYLGGRGIPLMAANPLIVTGLMIGTIVGVALFKGVPVGPLIAAGMMALILGVLKQ